MRQAIGLLFALIIGHIALAATKTAEWDLHPQAAELTGIELEWSTSADPTPVAQTVSGTDTRATIDIPAAIGDEIFVRARACKDALCSAWAGPVSVINPPEKVMRLRFSGVIEIVPE